MIGMGIPMSQSRTPRMKPILAVDVLAERGSRIAFRQHHRLVSGAGGGAARALLLVVLLLGAGCETDPVGRHFFGLGDPVRGAALHAPRNLGDTSRWAGQPAEAALAVAQLEFLAQEFRTNPRYAPEVDPTVTLQLERARAEMRQFLGIAPAAPPEAVIAALRRAAEALRGGSQASAEAALQSAFFTAGPLVTLARLGAMPRLPQTGAAARRAAAEIARLDNRRV